MPAMHEGVDHSAADQMGVLNAEVQKGLFARLQEQLEIAEMRQLGAAMDVNPKTMVRYAMIESQRQAQIVRKAAIAAARPMAEIVKGAPVLALKIDDILRDARELAKDAHVGTGLAQGVRTSSAGSPLQGLGGQGKRPGSTLASRAGSVFGGAQSVANNAPASGSHAQKRGSVSSPLPIITKQPSEAERAGEAMRTALDMLVKVKEKEQESRKSKLYTSNKVPRTKSPKSMKSTQPAPRAPRVAAAVPVNARDEPRRVAMTGEAEARLKALSTAEYMHRYVDRIAFNPVLSLNLEGGTGSSVRPESRHVDDEGEGEDPMDSLLHAGAAPGKDGLPHFPELRKHLRHIMAYTAGRIVLPFPAREFEKRWFTPLVADVVVLAFWHTHVRFIEERQRQKANRRRDKALKLALKGAAAVESGESNAPSLVGSRQPSMRKLSLNGTPVSPAKAEPSAPPEPESAPPDVELSLAEEEEADLAAALSPTPEGLASMGYIGHNLGLAYATLMRAMLNERLAADADERDVRQAAARAQQQERKGEGEEGEAALPGKRGPTLAEIRTLAVATARMSRLFLDVLPWAVADAVHTAYCYLLAGSKGTYGASFRLQLYVELGRLLTGVELAPVSVLSSLGKHFPVDPLAVLHREWATGAEAEAMHATEVVREGQGLDSPHSHKKRPVKARTPAQVSALLDGPTTGQHVTSSRRVKRGGGGEGAVEEGSGEADEEEADPVLSDMRTAHLAHALGFRTPYELFKSTKPSDRLLLGLGEAARVEVVRKLARTLALPISAFLMTGASVPPPLLHASASVGALLNLPPSGHASLVGVVGVGGGEGSSSLVQGHSLGSLGTLPSLYAELCGGGVGAAPSCLQSPHDGTATAGGGVGGHRHTVHDPTTLRTAPVLANPRLNRYLIHMEQWAGPALESEGGNSRLNEEEAEARRKAIMAQAREAAARRKGGGGKRRGGRGSSPQPGGVPHTPAHQPTADAAPPASPSPPPLALGRSLGDLLSSITGLAVKVGLKAASSPSGPPGALRSMVRMASLRVINHSDDGMTPFARGIAGNLAKLKKKVAAKGEGGAVCGGVGADVSMFEFVEDEEGEKEKERETHGAQSHQHPSPSPSRLTAHVAATALSPPPCSPGPSFLTYGGEEGEGEGQDQAPHTLPPPSTLHSGGVQAGTLTSPSGLASIVDIIPGGGLGAADADLATRMLTARARRLPLQVPFVSSSISTLLCRALPHVARGGEGGAVAVPRSVPVSWAHAGGVDTAHAGHKAARCKAVLDSIHGERARIELGVRMAADAAEKATLGARRAAESSRVGLTRGSAQDLAREAARVRQETIRAIAARAAASAKAREEKRLFAGAVADEEGAGGGAPPTKGNATAVLINRHDPGLAGAVPLTGDPVPLSVSLRGVPPSSLPALALNWTSLAVLAASFPGVSGQAAFALDMERMAKVQAAEKVERKAHAAIRAVETAEAAAREEEEKRKRTPR